ncbi:hypothetical protein D5086_004193 [Populus alba]|uniref:Uncharacterized protein n=1 Tax=Populus alba TaxID=43335 RepID=A0ACC4CPN3_POPAL
MPSEDAKTVKKEEVVKKEQGREGKEEEKSLSAIRQARKKNPTNAGSLATKNWSKVTKVKKEEPQDDDFDEPIKGKGKGSSGSSSKPVAKVKKEEANSDEDDDHKPIFKKTCHMRRLWTTYGACNFYEKKLTLLLGSSRPGFISAPSSATPLKVWLILAIQSMRAIGSAMVMFIPSELLLMESGLLSMEVAKKVYEKKQKNSKLTSPVKAASVTKKIQSATVTKKTPSSALPVLHLWSSFVYLEYSMV